MRNRRQLKVTEQQLSAARELLESDNPPSLSAISRHSSISRQTIADYQKRGILPYSKRQQKDANFEKKSVSEPPAIIVPVSPETSVLIQNRESEIHKLRVELEAIAYANILDFVVWDGNMVVLKPSHSLTRIQAASIKTIQQTKDGIKFQFHDKLTAITKLLQLFGVKTVDEPPAGTDSIGNKYLKRLQQLVEQFSDIEEAEVVD